MISLRPEVRFLVVALTLATGCGDRTGGGRGTGEPLLTLLPASRTGIAFGNDLPENAMRNGFTYEYYYNGAGVAVGDLNGDDLPDLYFAANMGPNRLYLNRGDFNFEDVTDRAGVAGLQGGWADGVTFVDVNADGRLDIHVSQTGPFAEDDLRRNLLYINQGERDGIPYFRNEAAAWGIDDPGLSTQAAFFDYDGDGDLDMYLMNHGIPGYRTIDEMRAGRSPAEVDRMYRNDGTRFVDVSAAAGLIDTNLGFGLGVSVGDLNNDGRPDVYVANDYSGRDYLYLGGAGGRFNESLAASMGHIPLASMGSDIADIDGDGWLDLVVLEMAMTSHYDRKVAEHGTERGHYAQMVREGLHHQYQANALQWNRGVSPSGAPVFSDVAFLAGVARTDWSWAPLLADFYNDGRPDLFVANGMAGTTMNADFDDYKAIRFAQVEAAEGRATHSLIVELLEDMPRQKVANHLYRNEGDLTFSDRSVEAGLTDSTYSQGAVYSDLDRDGDLDLVVSNLMGPVFVYRNNIREQTGARFLQVRLEGPAGNTFGVGARVTVESGGHTQVQELQLARGYLSSVEPVLHFGLAGDTAADTVRVRWPDGSVEQRLAVAADSRIVFRHVDAQPPTGADAPAEAPLFADASSAVPGAAQPPLTMPVDSTSEPYPTRRPHGALAVGDLNGDGLDDFVRADGTARSMRVFRQRADGSFDSRPLGAASEGAVRAVSIFDADGDGIMDVWAVTRSRTDAARHLLFLGTPGNGFRPADPGVSLADANADVTLAPADYDGDGRTDLFIGLRSLPGQGGASARLLHNEGGTFTDVTADVAPALDTMRTVTGALWADLDGTGTPELVIVGEWMPVTVLFNDGQRLRHLPGSTGLDSLRGWWQSVAAADIDADGDIDLIAGNIGTNFPYRPSVETPFELYVADFDGDGVDESVPAYFESDRRLPWYGRVRMGEKVAGVLDRYPTHDAYARATLEEILGATALTGARRFAVATLATTWLENVDGSRFLAHALPPAAQLSAVMGIAPADYDGDGRLDLVVGGNLQDLDPTVPGLDGGVGLFLRGDGAGGFEPVQPYRSGLWLTGEVDAIRLLRSGASTAPALVVGRGTTGLQYITARRRP